MAKHLKLGELLKSFGIIDDFQLSSALSYQRHWGGRFGESLIKLGYISEHKLQDFLARQFDLPQIDLRGREIEDEVLRCIPMDKAREFHVIPVELFETSDTTQLLVAMTDPTNLGMIDTLQSMSGCQIKPALACTDDIKLAIEHHYGHGPDKHQEPEQAVEEPCEKPETKEPPATRLAARKQLEDRYEKLVQILLDRGVLLPRDLEELT